MDVEQERVGFALVNVWWVYEERLDLSSQHHGGRE